MALRPSVADVLEVEEAGAPSLELDEVRIEASSPYRSRALADAFPGRPVLAIRRPSGHVTANPPPDLILDVGDLVLLLRAVDIPYLIPPATLVSWRIPAYGAWGSRLWGRDVYRGRG